jgi:hypothetical protein
LYDEFHAYSSFYPQGLIKLGAFFVYVAVIAFFLGYPWNLLSIVLPLFGIFIIFVSLMLMKEWFAFLFKKGTSQNVIGKIKPKKDGKPVDGKKKVVIAGHMDSATEMKIAKLGDKIAKITMPALGYIIVMPVFAIVKAILLANNVTSSIIGTSGAFVFTYVDLVFLILSIIGLPLLTYIIYGYTASSNWVEGANDNLAGVGIAYAIGKYFTEEMKLQNVELWVGTFGSEECGERGAHAFVKKYKPSGDMDNAFCVVPESCGAGSGLGIITYERMHFARHNLELCNKLFDAYKEYAAQSNDKDIIPCSVEALPYAASDAGRFSHANIPATQILGFDGAIMKPANWHALTDIPENLNVKMLDTVIGIIKTYIINLEKELSEK